MSLTLVTKTRMPAFGVLLRRYRLAAGMTIAELSAESGVKMRAIGSYERGERSPSFEQVVKLARALSVDLQEFADALNGDPPTE